MIQSTHERDSLVDDTKFLVLDPMSILCEAAKRSATHVRPVEGTGLEVTGATLNHDVGVQVCQARLGVVAVDGRRARGDLLVDDDVDLHTLARLLLQEIIELIFGLIRATELQLCARLLVNRSYASKEALTGRKPPIMNVDRLLRK